MAIHVDHYRASWGGSTTTVSISPIAAVARAFVLVASGSSLVTAANASQWSHAAELISTTQVRLTRATIAGSDAQTFFSVVWCDADEFRSEQVTALLAAPATTTTVPLTGGPYDLGRTMVAVSAYCGVTTASQNRLAYVTADLIDASTIRLRRGIEGEVIPGLGGVTTPHAYVVEWAEETGVTVQTGVDDLSGDMATAPLAIAHGLEADASRVLMLWQFRHSTSGLEQTSVESWLDGTSRNYRRHTATTSWVTKARWYAVVFPEGAGVRVERGGAEAGSTTTELPISVPSAFPSAVGLLAMHTNSCSGTGTGSARERWIIDSQGAGSATLKRWRIDQSARARLQLADLGSFVIPEPETPQAGHYDDEDSEDEGKDVIARTRRVVRLVVPDEAMFFELFFGIEADEEALV